MDTARGAETINRRDFLKTMTAGLAALAAGDVLPAAAAAADAQSRPAGRPNILFIISDQHTHDIMSCCGCDWVKTPNLDRLAAMGTRFTAAHVAYPLCVPSRAAIMTGHPPHQSEADPTKYPESLGRMMRQAGYETAYFGKWHVGKTKIDSVKEWHGFETAKEFGQHDAQTSEGALAFLKQRHDRPFFVVASYLNPHDCCEYARAQTMDLYAQRSKRDGTPLPAYLAGIEDRVRMRNGAVDVNPPIEICPPLPKNHQPCSDEAEVAVKARHPRSGLAAFGHPTESWTDNDWREYRWGYARLVEKMDDEVGRLLDALEQAGQLDNTVIVYTNDHGDGIGAHKWNQKWSFYEEPVRAPLIISWKGKTPARTAGPLINTGLDLLPTFCDYAGAQPPQGLLGLSIRPFTREKGLPANPREHKYVVSEMGPENSSARGRMVRSGRFKYIVYTQGANREMLFDMQEDPGEMKNLAVDAACKDVLADHRALLAEWRQATDDAAYPPAT